MLEERELAVVWGAVEHFVKPVQKEILVAALEKCKDKNPKSVMSVLLIDDDRNAVELVVSMLGGEAFKVLTAYGGKEAIDIAFKEHPDVIVLDLMMPVVSGFDVIKALKNNPETIDTPIIICTAKDLDSTDMNTLIENVSYIMHKGIFTREELIDSIKVLENRKYNKD